MWHVLYKYEHTLMTWNVAAWTNFMHVSEYIHAKCNALQLTAATQKVSAIEARRLVACLVITNWIKFSELSNCY